MKLLPTLLSTVLLAACATPASDDQADSVMLLEGDKRCINLNQIDGLEILDSQHIAFRAKRNQYFVNELPRKCTGLRKNKAIMYRVTMHRLCDLDSISVLDTFGVGFREGPRCGLGKFTEMDRVELQELKESLEFKGPDLD